MRGLRKYLTPFAPDQSGAVSVLYEFGGIIVICDAGGCTGNICGFDEPRWFESKSALFSAGLRDHLIERVLHEIPYTRLNGDRTDRLPNNANFCFRFIEGESMLILLDQAGICGSSGSACTSGSLDPSHVLLAIGLPHEIAHGSLRLTLSEKTTMEEIDYTVDKLKAIIERLRSMSPLYEDFVRKNKEE